MFRYLDKYSRLFEEAGKNANISRRSSHKNHIKGPKKRTEEDDERFAQSFEKMILMAKSKEELRNTERVKYYIKCIKS